jgi:hypothetical protein
MVPGAIFYSDKNVGVGATLVVALIGNENI